MARPIARDAEDFARLMLRALEQPSGSGGWQSVRELFERAAADHPEHPFLGQLAARPGRRGALNAALERLRASEFPGIERCKEGGRRNGATLYRAGPAATSAQAFRPVALDLQLPYETPASHPLRGGESVLRREPARSARRTALTLRLPNSPWRRRLLARRLPLAPDGLGRAMATLRGCWHKLRAAFAGLAAGAGGG